MMLASRVAMKIPTVVTVSTTHCNPCRSPRYPGESHSNSTLNLRKATSGREPNLKIHTFLDGNTFERVRSTRLEVLTVQPVIDRISKRMFLFLSLSLLLL